MKKVFVTDRRATPFEGVVILIYGEAGMGPEAFPPLLDIDFRQALMKDDEKYRLLQLAPLRISPGYEQQWGTDKLQIVVQDYELDFEKDFFKPYGKPVNKARCLLLWQKLSAPKRALAVAGLAQYLWYLGQKQWREKADPESYLRKKMWETNWREVS